MPFDLNDPSFDWSSPLGQWLMKVDSYIGYGYGSGELDAPDLSFDEAAQRAFKLGWSPEEFVDRWSSEPSQSRELWNVKEEKTMDLKEFFAPVLREGPLDPTFHAAPEVKPSDASSSGDLPPAEEPMTQDVAAMSASSLSFFSKNVQSAVSKYGLEQEGFNTAALQEFAAALDEMAFQMYQGVQEPAERQAFESDYQRVAADWSKDLVKLFEKVLKLKGHAPAY